MSKLTRNIVIFLITFLTVQVCAMYIVGGFDHQTITSKLVSCFIGTVLGMTVLFVINDSE